MTVSKELLKEIQEQIDKVSLSDEFNKKWLIQEVKDWVATIVWLDDVTFSEIVVFENETKWLVLDMKSDEVWVLILWEYTDLNQWDTVKATGTVFSVWVWENFVWRVVNGLWNPIDGEGDIKEAGVMPVERIAPWVIARKWVDQPMLTGLKAIDAMIPIGRGQRELIIWDRQTGKTTVAIDSILNQKETDITCVYVSIWQKESKVRRIVETLKKEGAMDYTIVVSASASDPAVTQYLAPYIGCALAEYFMYKGEDTMVVYDDLSKHAVAYREVSLLLRRPPGREAYPGDVFYLHSRLLERAAKLSEEYIEKETDGAVKGKTGSMTALPIIETQAGDVSAYIPTNVISITDGQIFLKTDLFNSWIRPAIDVGNSVSRVWWAAQYKIMKKVAGKLKLSLAVYREMSAFSQFASDLDEATQQVLSRGERMVEMLKQWVNQPIPFEKQTVLMYAWVNGYLDTLEVDEIIPFEEALYEKLSSTYTELSSKIISEGKLTDEIEESMKSLVDEALAEISG